MTNSLLWVSVNSSIRNKICFIGEWIKIFVAYCTMLSQKLLLLQLKNKENKIEYNIPFEGKRGRWNK